MIRTTRDGSHELPPTATLNDAPSQAARMRDGAALGALAFALGMVRSGNKSVWFDEAVSAEHAGRSLAGLLPVITGGDPNMALYYLLLNLWRRLFGDGEVALRSLSAVAAAGAVVALYGLGTRLFGRRVGTLAALLLALNAFLIEYAQMTRGYTLVACLVALSCWSFVLELQRPTPGTRAAFVLASALAVYAHYFAALVLLAQLGTLVVMRRRYPITPGRIATALALVALCVPAALFARAGGAGRIAWVPPLDLLSLPIVVVKLAGRSFALGALFCLAAAWAANRLLVTWYLRGGLQDRWPLAFVLAWLATPLAIALGVSFVRPVLLAQYLIVCLPAFCLLTAAALVRVEAAKLGRPLLGLCLVLSAARLVALYRLEGEENWRSVEAYVGSQLRAGDRVAFFPSHAEKPFAFYAERSRRAIPLERFGGARDSARRVWLVVRSSDARRRGAEVSRLRAMLGATRAPGEPAYFREVSVERFERVSDGPPAIAQGVSQPAATTERSRVHLLSSNAAPAHDPRRP